MWTYQGEGTCILHCVYVHIKIMVRVYAPGRPSPTSILREMSLHGVMRSSLTTESLTSNSYGTTNVTTPLAACVHEDALKKNEKRKKTGRERKRGGGEREKKENERREERREREWEGGID